MGGEHAHHHCPGLELRQGGGVRRLHAEQEIGRGQGGFTLGTRVPA
jgi:hypothetical protein